MATTYKRHAEHVIDITFDGRPSAARRQPQQPQLHRWLVPAQAGGGLDNGYVKGRGTEKRDQMDPPARTGRCQVGPEGSAGRGLS